MKTLGKRLAAVLPRRLSLLDAGARGGLKYPWSEFAPAISTIAVEPDPVEAERLQSAMAPGEGRVLPVALWSREERLTLRLTKSPGCSSVFEPNQEFLRAFPDADRFAVLREVELDAVTVDSLAESGKLGTVDFAKIDVQGAEMAILEGGRQTFRRELVGLEVEVEFAPKYKGQPLFSDLERFARETLGLELWDISRVYWKYRSGITRGPAKGKLVFGDALFLRPPAGLGDWLDGMSVEKAGEKLAMVVVAGMAYGYSDYAAEVLASEAARDAIPPATHAALLNASHTLGRGTRLLGRGNPYAFAILDALAKSVRPAFSGWALADDTCGSRRRGPFWI